MNVKSFVSILVDEIHNNTLRQLWEEDVNITTPFLLVPLPGDHWSFNTNHSLDTEIFPRDIEMVVMSEYGYHSDLFS